MTKDEKIAKLGKEITDRATVLLGKDKITPDAPEYLGINSALKFTAVKYDEKMADDILDIALTMKKRVPLTIEQLAKKNPQFDRAYLEKALQALSESGLVEFHWENLDGKNPNHAKRWVLDMFVPGSAEIMMINPEQSDMFPETADFFERMAYLPLAGITEMVPPGGAGIGMHVIPVEKAIPAESKSLPIEHLSHWLKKYEGHIGVSVCSCRKQQRIRGEGSGDVEGEWCIGVGDFADYCRETNHGRDITYEEAMEILQKAEDRGYVHQITNIDGENKIFGICNCAVGVCNALRTSQLFNTPNMSRSAYVAKVEKENCVACGRCVEYCPAGAVKLGQKLCTKSGPIVYPRQELPDAAKWGPEKWTIDYRDKNRINCYDTGTAPCKTACPAHIAVQGYLKMAAQGRYRDALSLIKKENPFPAVCGRICNRRCEDACTRGTIDQAVAIDAVKKFIAQQDLNAESRYVPPVVQPSLQGLWKQKIAIIGGGPAGLSCAYFLALQGYKPTVFEKNPHPGGMLRYGIPSFKLEKDVIDAEIEILKELGVEIRCGVEVGKEVTLADLRADGYKAFYLAIGCQGGRKAGVPGEEAAGIQTAVNLLRTVGDDENYKMSGRTVVIGGGNVAIDAARVSLRCGADAVTMVCLEPRDGMPASAEEIAEAEEEGTAIRCGYGPKEFVTENGHVTAVVLKKCTGLYNPEGRFAPTYDENDTITLPCDNVVLSIGQCIEWGDLLDGEAVELGRGQGAVADPVTYQTAQPDVFVGGDVYTGPRFAIDAIAAGKQGAVSIHRFVQPNTSMTIGRNRREFFELDKGNLSIGEYDHTPRQQAAVDEHIDAHRSFRDAHLTLTETQVRAETARCLGCGASVVDPNKCIGCGVCTTKCEFDAIHLHRDLPQCSKMVKSEDKFKAILPYMAKREIKIRFAKKGK